MSLITDIEEIGETAIARILSSVRTRFAPVIEADVVKWEAELERLEADVRTHISEVVKAVGDELDKATAGATGAGAAASAGPPDIDAPLAGVEEPAPATLGEDVPTPDPPAPS
jgi:hypothetical protein